MGSRSSLAISDRRTQRAMVLGALGDRRMSRTDLGEHFSVSSSLITRIVRSLIDDTMVREIGAQSAAMGRPPIQLEVARGFGALLAVSCSSAGIEARSTDLHGNLIAELCIDTTGLEITPDTIVEAIANLAGRTPRLMGIGVGVPGIVDRETGNVSTAPDLGWSDAVPLREILRARFGVTVTIDNDVNLMMAAERGTLEGRDRRNAVYLYLGARGVGAGVVAGGRLIEGDHGAAGEVGLVSIAGPSVADDTDFEDVAATTAIAARLAEGGHAVTEPIVPMLLGLADSGDPVAVDIRAEVLAVFAQVILLLTAILDPSVVLLGGHARSFRDVERDEIAAALHGRFPFAPEIRFARLEPDVVLDSARTRCWSQILAGGV